MVTTCTCCGGLFETTTELAYTPIWADDLAHICCNCWQRAKRLVEGVAAGARILRVTPAGVLADAEGWFHPQRFPWLQTDGPRPEAD
jgi:hypothetical protein